MRQPLVSTWDLLSQHEDPLGCVRAPAVSEPGWVALTCGLLVPRPGTEPTSPEFQGGFLTPGPPGKFRDDFFIWLFTLETFSASYHREWMTGYIRLIWYGMQMQTAFYLQIKGFFFRLVLWPYVFFTFILASKPNFHLRCNFTTVLL